MLFIAQYIDKNIFLIILIRIWDKIFFLFLINKKVTALVYSTQTTLYSRSCSTSCNNTLNIQPGYALIMSCCSFDNCNLQGTTITSTTTHPRCNSNNKIFNSYYLILFNIIIIINLLFIIKF